MVRLDGYANTVKCLTLMLVALTTFLFVMAKPVTALKIGDWEGVCMAPNWQTGEMQRVKETEVSVRPLHPWFARTSRNEDGTWQTDFNVFVMLSFKLSDDAKKFIFYHECAHARLDEASERRADCEALLLMRQEIIVTEQAIKDISHAYLLILRTFPTGGPCYDGDGTQTATTR